MAQDKAKLIARWGRKATGLKKTAGLPEGLKKAKLPWGQKVAWLSLFQTGID